MNKLRIVSNKSQCHPTIVTVVRSIFSVACQQLVNRLGTLSKKRFPIDRDIVNGKKESSSIPSTRQNFDEKKGFFKKCDDDDDCWDKHFLLLLVFVVVVSSSLRLPQCCSILLIQKCSMPLLSLQLLIALLKDWETFSRRWRVARSLTHSLATYLFMNKCVSLSVSQSRPRFTLFTSSRQTAQTTYLGISINFALQ